MIELGWRRAPGVDGVHLVDGSFADELPPPGVLADFLVGHYVEGEAELWRPGGTATIRAGQVLLGTPGHVVRVMRRLSPRGRLRSVLVTPAAMAAALADLDGGDLPLRPARVVADGHLPAATAAFAGAVDGGDPLAVQSAFVELTAAFAGVDLDARVPFVERGLMRVRERLHDQLGRSVSLDELAELARLSKFHLVRRFTASYGLPPHSYHMRLRLERARAMLGSGGRIVDLVTELGFADQSHLTRRFTRAFGISPARYRARALGR